MLTSCCFCSVKANRWDGSKPSKRTSVTKEFPLAPFHGPISSDIAHVWESRRHPSGSQQSKYPLYEKVIYLVYCCSVFNPQKDHLFMVLLALRRLVIRPSFFISEGS